MRLLLAPFGVTLTLAMPGEPAPAQSARYLLTRVGQNIDVGNWQITARETRVAPCDRERRLAAPRRPNLEQVAVPSVVRCGTEEYMWGATRKRASAAENTTLLLACP
jgi:hypothetical protein